MEARRKTFYEGIGQIAAERKFKTLEDYIIYHKGRQYPSAICKPETFKALEKFEARKDDVVLISYPKCGNNWVTQILSGILNCYKAGKKGNEVDFCYLFLDFETSESIEAAKNAVSPRLLSTHMHCEDIPASIFGNKTKKLLLLRNPKDAVVSYYLFHQKNPILPTFEWDEFFNRFMAGEVYYGSYFEHLLNWDKYIDDGTTLVITFEELKEDLAEGVRKIATFYGFTLSEDQIKSVADASTFNAMKEKTENAEKFFNGQILRKGVVGDWKNYITEAQNKEMDAKFEECLAGTKLGKMLKYDVYCKA